MQKIAMRPIRYKYSLIVINNKAKKDALQHNPHIRKENKQDLMNNNF